MNTVLELQGLKPDDSVETHDFHSGGETPYASGGEPSYYYEAQTVDDALDA